MSRWKCPTRNIDRLKGKAGLAGVATPVSDIGMIFLNDIDADAGPERPQGRWRMAIDKQPIIDRLLSGYGVPIDTLETPEYDRLRCRRSRRPTTRTARRNCWRRRAISPDNPVKFTIQTTSGFKPKDYEMIQAIVGLWRKVGIEATIEVYEIAKHYELRAADTAGAGGVLQLGQLGRRSDDLDRLRDVRPLARIRSGTART